MTADAPEYLFWLDLETTGLSPYDDLILEVAVVVTTADLTRVVDTYDRVIHSDYLTDYDTVADFIEDPKVVEIHTASNLIHDVNNYGFAEDAAVSDVEALAAKYEGAYLAGSGVHFDREFLHVKWPDVVGPLHYRNLDISSLRTFVNLYAPHAAYQPKKAHRAMADVQDAIAELRHYRAALAAEVTV